MANKVIKWKVFFPKGVIYEPAQIFWYILHRHEIILSVLLTHKSEKSAQFENRIKPRVYVRHIMVVLCTKKLHFVSRKKWKENYN